MKPTEGWRRERRFGEGMRDDVLDEMKLHISGRIAEYVAAGMTRDEARARAEREFGDLSDLARGCRTSDRKPQPRHLMVAGRETLHGIVKDAAHAVRSLAHRPGYTAAVVLTLILGIGVTTAVFSVVNGVLLQPLPHPDAEQLVLIWEVDQRPDTFEDENVVAAANFNDWKEQNRVFTDVTAFQQYPITVHTGEQPLKVTGGYATKQFFETLGVNAAMGRTFLDEEIEPGAEPVAMLGHDFWRTRFRADSTVLGSTITTGQAGTTARTIVGVLPADFTFLDQQPDVWLPLPLTESQLDNRRSHYLNVLARMQPGVTVDDAQRDMERVVSGLAAEYPQYLAGWSVNVVSMTDQIVGRIKPALVVLLGAVGFVLLIAVVNVANLMLARTFAASRELAIRTALGAGRGRLVRLSMVESLVLALVGGALGVATAIGVTRVLIAMAPANLPRSELIGIDVRVLVFAAVVTVVTGVLFGLAPALQASRTNVASGLKEGSTRSTSSRGQLRLRSVFVVTQLAFSAVLLVSAGLMLTTFASLMRVDLGYDPGGVASMTVTLTGEQYTERAAQVQLFDRLVPEIARLPEVQYASATKFLPLEGSPWTWSVQVVGKPERREGEKRDYGYHVVSPDYFRAMGITTIRGRVFDERDRDGSIMAMVINESFVRRFFAPDEDPLGQRVYVISREEEVYEIVGIVEDTRYAALDTEADPAYYVNYAQVPFDFFLAEMSIVTKTSTDPASAIGNVRSIIRQTDRSIVVTGEQTMTTRIHESVARTRFAMTLLITFAAVALGLAVIGIYGVIAYSIGQRAQEIGVRIALGAEPRRIITQFVGAGARLIAVGLGLGLLGAAFVTRFQRSLLFGVDAVDPLTYGTVAIVLSGAAVLAVYVPAKRASRVDPMRVLRNE